MAQTVRELMTSNPVTCAANASLTDASRRMKDHDIGAVIALDGNKVCGVVTDRDIVVRAIAEGRDPGSTKLGDICSRDLVTVRPDDPIEKAVHLMQDHALRRLPVLEGDKAVGIVSIGDLAIERDPKSALAGISSAPGNR